jgi:hypothetical protein
MPYATILKSSFNCKPFVISPFARTCEAMPTQQELKQYMAKHAQEARLAIHLLFVAIVEDNPSAGPQTAF